jgi:hypothetical protein
MKAKFAKNIGVPKKMNLKTAHIQIVQDNINPEFTIKKESWINPRLTSPMQESKIEKQRAFKMHSNCLTSDLSMC